MFLRKENEGKSEVKAMEIRKMLKRKRDRIK